MTVNIERDRVSSLKTKPATMIFIIKSYFYACSLYGRSKDDINVVYEKRRNYNYI